MSLPACQALRPRGDWQVQRLHQVAQALVHGTGCEADQVLIQLGPFHLSPVAAQRLRQLPDAAAQIGPVSGIHHRFRAIGHLDGLLIYGAAHQAEKTQRADSHELVLHAGQDQPGLQFASWGLHEDRLRHLLGEAPKAQRRPVRHGARLNEVRADHQRVFGPYPIGTGAERHEHVEAALDALQPAAALQPAERLVRHGRVRPVTGDLGVAEDRAVLRSHAGKEFGLARRERGDSLRHHPDTRIQYLAV